MGRRLHRMSRKSNQLRRIRGNISCVQRDQDQPPLARVSCASLFSIEVIESKSSRRSAVRSSAWLDGALNPVKPCRDRNEQYETDVKPPTAHPQPLEYAKDSAEAHQSLVWKCLECSSHHVFREAPACLGIVRQKRDGRAEALPLVRTLKLQTPHKKDVQ